jgi:hypothetical protein
MTVDPGASGTGNSPNPKRRLPFRDPIFSRVPGGTRVVVEVGSWQGAWPKRFLAYVPGDYVIYCVDWWRGDRGEANLARFRKNVAKELEVGKIVEVRKASLEAVAEWDKVIDVLFIDGDHLDVYRDLVAWLPHVRHKGLVLGHDFSGHHQSHAVQRALIRYFGDQVPYRTGAWTGRTQGAAWRIHSFWFFKAGKHGQQDERSQAP